MRLSLIQRDDCSLCDEAWEVLAAAGIADFEAVWIERDPIRAARYGLRVPVLRDEASGRELDWPFAAADVKAFAAGG